MFIFQMVYCTSKVRMRLKTGFVQMGHICLLWLALGEVPEYHSTLYSSMLICCKYWHRNYVWQRWLCWAVFV